MEEGKKMQFLGAVTEEDDSLSIYAKDPENEKIYKFEKCWPKSCRTDTATGVWEVKDPKEQPFNLDFKIDIPPHEPVTPEVESNIRKMLADWYSYLKE